MLQVEQGRQQALGLRAVCWLCWATTWMFSSKPPHSGPAAFRAPPVGARGVAMLHEASRGAEQERGAWGLREEEEGGEEEEGAWLPAQVGRAGSPKSGTRMFGPDQLPETGDVGPGGSVLARFQIRVGATLPRRRGRQSSRACAPPGRGVSHVVGQDGGLQGGGGDAEPRGFRRVWRSQCM